MQHKRKPGRPVKLGEDRPIVDDVRVLERSRRRFASGEYRTYFHIGQSWGVNESTAYRTIRQIEDILIQEENFHFTRLEDAAKVRLPNRSSSG